MGKARRTVLGVLVGAKNIRVPSGEPIVTRVSDQDPGRIGIVATLNPIDPIRSVPTLGR